MLNDKQIHFVYKCFRQYANMSDNFTPTFADVQHSALLARLLSGKPVYVKAPPKMNSYPCYDLADGESVLISNKGYVNGIEWKEINEQDERYQHIPLIDTPYKLYLHIPTDDIYMMFEEETQPIWVHDGKPENHKFIGCFLRKITNNNSILEWNKP